VETLEVSWRLLPLGQHIVAGVGWFVTNDFFFLFLFSLLLSKFTLAIENLRVIHLFIEILTSIFILFISNFCSWPFYKISVFFQFHHWIQICNMLFFLIWSSFFWLIFILFWVILLNWFFFSILPFNKKLLVVLYLFFISILIIIHFITIFLSFCIIDFSFPISSFNIWLVEN